MVTNSCEFLLESHGRKGKLHCRLQSQICIQSWKMDTVHYGNWEGRMLHAEACKLARRKEILLKEFWASYRSSQFMNMCWSCLFIGLRYVRSYQTTWQKVDGISETYNQLTKTKQLLSQISNALKMLVWFIMPENHGQDNPRSGERILTCNTQR